MARAQTIFLSLSRGAAVLAAVLAIHGTALADPCDHPEDYYVVVPYDGDPAKMDYATARADLASKGLSASEIECVIAGHLSMQSQAVALGLNTPIGQQLASCVQNWLNTNGTSATLGAYIARLSGSEKKAQPVHHCNCELNGYGFNIKLNGADSTEYNLIYCHESGRAMQIDYFGQEVCKSEKHTFVKISSKKAKKLSEAPDEFLPDTVVQADNAFCSWDVGLLSHRNNDGCFGPDTRIRMADGSLRPIKKIQAGDSVWVPTLQKAVTVEKVLLGAQPTPLYELSYDDKKIVVTDRHPFIVPEEAFAARMSTISLKSSGGSNGKSLDIRLARDLNAGDEIMGEDGKLKSLTSVRVLPLKENQEVYNLVVQGEGKSLYTHSVAAEGFITGDYIIQTEVNTRLAN